jgi:glycosyltransferase involved in cell wall biosynthesis
MKHVHWMILTGEYPPQGGGVADYTQQVARAFVACGDGAKVQVWAPPCSDAVTEDQGVRVHRLPDHFGPKSLKVLSEVVREPDPARIILVQYVPHAFGHRAMNVRFCAWLLMHRDQRIWTMFHEVAFPFARKQPLRHQVLAAVTHGMALMVARASSRIFISTTAWQKKVRRKARSGTPIEWTAIPSNVGEKAEDSRQKAEGGHPVIAHFGAYGVQGSRLEEEIIALLFADSEVHVRLLGRGGEVVANSIADQHPKFRDRVMASGALSSLEVTEHLADADLVFQPYPDGVTTRRSSLMAALRLGRPVITTSGFRTEDIWRKSEAVELVNGDDPRLLTQRTIALLRDAPRRAELAVRAKRFYDEHFDLRHTIGALRRAAEAI